jgi:hypothetical protein
MQLASNFAFNFNLRRYTQAAMACAGAAAPGLSAGKGYVDVSTVDAGTSAAVAKLIAATGAEFLEAPVSGRAGYMYMLLPKFRVVHPRSAL